jgi:glycosyltransferase involved in cell wall biosynthesis
MPVRNGERYMAEAVESILRQDFPDFELVISDNGSSDATEELGREFERQDERVRYLRVAENLGAAWNYNRLVHDARGELFKWAAHDDVCAPTLLSRCVDALDSGGPDVVLAYPKTLLMDADGNVTGSYEDGYDLRQTRVEGRVRQWCRRHGGYFNPIFGVIRHDALLRTHLMQAYYGADAVALLELALLGRFVEVPEELFTMRVHAASSVKANATASAMTGWWDPRRRTTVWLPNFRLLAEMLRTTAAAPLPIDARLRATLILGRELAALYAVRCARDLQRLPSRIRAELVARGQPGS